MKGFDWSRQQADAINCPRTPESVNWNGNTYKCEKQVHSIE